MSGAAGDPRRVQHALAYLAAQHGGDAARAAQAAAQATRWRAKAPANEAAWQLAQSYWQAVAGVAPQLRADIAPDDAWPAQRAARRRLLRRAGGGAGVLGMAWLAGWLGLRHWSAPTYAAQWATRAREHLPRIALPDASVLALAADSALQAQFWRDRRELRLAHGSVYFEIARDVQRPLTVRTRLGQVQVLGTAFSVSDRGRDIEVQVAHGHVRVQALSGESRELRAGQRLALRQGGDAFGALRSAPADATQDIAAWRSGWWRFSALPLADVAAEFNAYVKPGSHERLYVSARAATLRLTGSFALQRPETLLTALPRALPVQLRRTPQGLQLTHRDEK